MRARTVGAVIVGLGFLSLIGAVWVPALRARRHWRNQADAAPHHVSPSVSGDQLIGVVIVSSTCAWSSRANFPSTIREMNRLLVERAAQDHRRFIAVGVAVDWSATVGFEFLRRFGPFDEILAGGNWANTGAIDYLWRLPPSTTAPSGTPEVLIFERHVAWDSAGRNLQVGENRKAGVDQIDEWVKMQAPLR